MRTPMPRRLIALLLLGACAPATAVPAATEAGATPSTEEVREQADPIPAGLGSLHQDQFSLSLREGDLLLKITPLEESVIRLAAPDTYDRLRTMAGSRLEQAREEAYSDEPELVLVSFFSYSPDVDYRPDDIVVVQHGRQMRPVAVLPVTSGWGRSRLQQREIQNAIYVFDQDIDYAQPLTVRYGHLETPNWLQVIPTLDRERARVRARTGS
jgi:hypothetical protein